MKRLYFDAISYGEPQLKSLIEQVGEDRIMFGTDNPFFPPLNCTDITTAQWPSTNNVIDTFNNMISDDIKHKISFGNATKIFKL